MTVLSRPTVTCTVCKMTRHPELHMSGSGHPVRKAEKWLRRRCGSPDACDFTYRAGIALGGPAQGQGTTGISGENDG